MWWLGLKTSAFPPETKKCILHGGTFGRVEALKQKSDAPFIPGMARRQQQHRPGSRSACPEIQRPLTSWPTSKLTTPSPA